MVEKNCPSGEKRKRKRPANLTVMAPADSAADVNASINVLFIRNQLLALTESNTLISCRANIRRAVSIAASCLSEL